MVHRELNEHREVALKNFRFSTCLLTNEHGVVMSMSFQAVEGECGKVKARAREFNTDDIYEQVINCTDDDINDKMNAFAAEACAHFASRNTTD